MSLDGRVRSVRFCSRVCSYVNRSPYATSPILRKAGRRCPFCLSLLPMTRHANTVYCSRRCTRAAARLEGYGLDVTSYRAMLDGQGNRCAICKQPEKSWRADLARDGWHIDHDHETGEIRGVLCPPCNLLLGFAADDPAVLRAAAEYLERSP